MTWGILFLKMFLGKKNIKDRNNYSSKPLFAKKQQKNTSEDKKNHKRYNNVLNDFRC